MKNYGLINNFNKMGVKIFSGSSNIALAENIAKKFYKDQTTSLNKIEISKFNDSEIGIQFMESVRKENVFLIQATSNSDNIMELFLMLDAAKRASAKEINVVIPYFGYARQDRKDKPRVPIAAKLLTDLLTAAGATRVITLDLHVDQIQGFLNIPLDHLSSSYIFLPYIRANFTGEDMVIASPDIGGSKRASKYSKALDVDLVLVHKEREKAGVISSMKLIGDVKGKHVIMVDDLIDTGSSICKAADLIMNNGALSVRAMICHPLLTGNAIEKIKKSKLTELIITDSLPINGELCDKITILSIDKLFSKAMRRIVSGKSITDDIFGSV